MLNIAPNLLDRDFTADRPNQTLAGDISYFWTREGWRYLAVIPDLHSRRVIGWAVRNRMKRDPLVGRQCLHRRKAGDPCVENGYRLAIAAQGLHLSQRPPSNGLQANRCWDMGSQYCSHDCQKVRR